MAERERCAKRRFRTELDARIALNSVGSKRDRQESRGQHVRKVEARAYRCPVCKGWHLTSRGERA